MDIKNTMVVISSFNYIIADIKLRVERVVNMHFLEEVKFIKRNIILSLILVCLLSIFNIEDAIAQSQADVASAANAETVHMVVLDGTPEELKELLHKNINVNEKYLCSTLLMTAVKSMARGKNFADYPKYAIEKVKMLINAGADINESKCGNRVGSSPLTWAVTLPMQVQALEIDLNKTIDENILLGQGNIDVPGVLSKPYKDVTKEEREQIRTYFHTSFTNLNKNFVRYYMEMINLLVDSGADVNAKGFEDGTPLHHAAMVPQEITLEPLKYLISEKANINARDTNGNTPLFFAFSMGNDEAVKLLIDAGADVAIRNNEGALYNQVRGERKRFVVDSNSNLHVENLTNPN